jgi:hypothetical protein
VRRLHTRRAELACAAAVGSRLESRRPVTASPADGTRLPAGLVVVGRRRLPPHRLAGGVGPGAGRRRRLRRHAALQRPARLGRRRRRARRPARARAGAPGALDLRAEQGTRAGANAVAVLQGEPAREHAAVPYFWSDVYGSKLQMVGLPTTESELVGDPEGPWLLLYRRDDRLAGALSLDLPGRIMKFRALLARGASFDDARELAHSKPLVTAR